MTATAKPASLWRHRDFVLLWAGQSVSELGSSVTMIAVPLVAVVLLGASPLQVGLLSAATTLPFLLIALPAGLIVDRIRKRALMIACDVARMLMLGSIPLAAAFGDLTIIQLYVVALLAGIATVFFDVAYQSYVPGLIGREQLVDGNGKLQASQSLSGVVGPGLGSGLFGLLRAGAVAVDAASFAVSWIAMLAIRTPEPQVERQPASTSPARLRTELLAGLSFVLRHPVLRKIAACTGTANLFGSMASAMEILFMVRVLHIHPGYTGLLIAAGAIGGVVAGITSGAVGRRIGTARIIWVSMLALGWTGLLIPLAEPGWRVALIPVGFFGYSATAVLYNIAQLSFRQSICPPELLGRMNAAIRWIVWGTLPVGGLLGGVLATAVSAHTSSEFGLRTTMWVGFGGSWAAALWVILSPLRTMRDIPASDVADGGGHEQESGLIEAT